MQNSTTATDRDSGYQGWSNYETWAVALWLDNEQSSYEWVRDLARTFYDDATETTYATRGQAAAWSLAEHLKDHHDECNPLEDGAPSVFTDLLRAALSSVDWHELGHHYVTEVLAERDA